MSIKSIICGITGSENSSKAIKVATDMAFINSSNLTFIYVVDIGFLQGLTIQLTPKYAEEFLERLGDKILEEAVEIAKSKGVRANKVMRKGKIMDEVFKVIKENSGDLFIIGDEGQSFAEKVLFGKRLPDNVKEIERLLGIPLKIVN